VHLFNNKQQQQQQQHNQSQQNSNNMMDDMVPRKENQEETNHHHRSSSSSSSSNKNKGNKKKKKKRRRRSSGIDQQQTNNSITSSSSQGNNDTTHNANHNEKKPKKKKITKTHLLLEGFVLSISTDSLRMTHQHQQQQQQQGGGSSNNSSMTRNSQEDDDIGITATDDNKDYDNLLSYKQACAMAQELGATVSAQVHNKVHAVLCPYVPSSSSSSSSLSSSSSSNSNKGGGSSTGNGISITQRMKKAFKKSIPIWDIQWLVEMHKCRTWIDPQAFNVTQFVKELWLQQQQQEQQQQQQTQQQTQQQDQPLGRKEVDVQDESDEEYLSTVDKGWSEPVSLDCCCVCHDDDRDDCPWCLQGETKCSVILKREKDKLKTCIT